MKHFLRNNGLSLVWLGLFFVCFFTGQTISGQRSYNEDQRAHDRPELTLPEYLQTAHFVEATMENWESEFLQMFLFVTLTAFLYQKGSAESKDPEKAEEVDRNPRQSQGKSTAPWPVRRGGWVLAVYQNSLGLALFCLFAVCFFLHAAGGAREYSEEQAEHGSHVVISLSEYLATSRFWFESFQNWQSEFLAVGSMVLLSIWLRQRGSPESKPVHAPHSQTGKD
jgi:hypothetical protein